ncbi:zinc protease [Azospirillum thiophilum]|uniref:Zinc protease n=1 Tax=Azospirillum thiophilum TaxID=528244 RepID=A0AAC8VUT8_9PROT|nr:pitrilysin family protein [Azospirillum thiophilum]ALG69707.1 zinc protease [Azospirillum thiophilum]KJR66612.1 zinc protease [Azospirillum thiophilum]
MSARHNSMRSGIAAFFLAIVAMALTAPLPARAMDIKRVVSPGGIEAWLVEDHKVPVLALEWAFEGAGGSDPKGKEGLANLVTTMLDEGAGPYDSQAFQARLQDNAIALGFDAGRDGFSGSLRTLTERRGEALELTRLALTEPHFAQEALDRMRASIMASLKRDLGDPNYVARRQFYATAFPGHPYGGEIRGTLDSLPAIAPDDLRAFVKGQFGRDRLVVAATGDISPEELGKALDIVFGGLPARTDAPAIPDATMAGLGQTILLPRPTAQTVMLMGQPGVKRDDPDWYAASVMNYVLGGGGFGSRLMEEVREKRGLSYGVYSYLIPMDHAAVVMAGGSTVNAKAGQALDIIRQEWARMARDGLTDQELADAKTYLTGSFPLQLGSTQSIARILLQVKRDELGIDYLNQRDRYINAVTQADIKRVAQRLLDPAKLLTVLVGKPEGVSPTRTVDGGS